MRSREFSARDRVDVLLGDLPAASLTIKPKLIDLHRAVLIRGRNASVESDIHGCPKYLRPPVRQASAGCTMVQMPRKKLPPDVLEWFRKMGAKGGKQGGSAGGKTSAANMTAKERKARAKNAVAVREAKRRAKRKASD